MQQDPGCRRPGPRDVPTGIRAHRAGCGASWADSCAGERSTPSCTQMMRQAVPVNQLLQKIKSGQRLLRVAVAMQGTQPLALAGISLACEKDPLDRIGIDFQTWDIHDFCP